MSFSRVQAFGWGVGDPLTSAQMNALDIDHANSLDKSIAGDTLVGTIALSGASAAIVLPSTIPAPLIKSDDGLLFMKSSGISVGNGKNLSVASGGVFSLSDGCNFTAVLAAGCSITTKAGTNGKIVLGDGPSDIEISPTVSRTVKQPIVHTGLQSGWIAAVSYVRGPATAQPQALTITELHNGARLASVKCHIIVGVGGAHAAVPATFPTFEVRRAKIADGEALANSVSLFSGGAKSFTAASAAAWDNTNLMQHETFTCDQNHTIDTSLYEYFVVVTDENGANSVAGNYFLGFELAYTLIADMRFP